MRLPASLLLLPAALLLASCGAPTQASAPLPPDSPRMGAAAHALSCGTRQMPEQILHRINEVRASGARCGGRAMAPVAPLRWDSTLQSVAAGHSADMARRNYFEHATPEGRTVRDRVNAGHYAGKFVGENIAAGSRGVDDTMRMWMESEGHCRNIMDPGFRDVAVACVQQPQSSWGTYWTMVLGRR